MSLEGSLKRGEVLEKFITVATLIQPTKVEVKREVKWRGETHINYCEKCEDYKDCFYLAQNKIERCPKREVNYEK